MESTVRGRAVCLALAMALAAMGCGGATVPPTASTPADSSSPPASPTFTSRSPAPSRLEGRGETPVVIGEPIGDEQLTGRIVFDDFEDVFTMNADGSDLRTIAGRPGPEFDGAWSPDGRMVVYRDSRHGINEDDEIFIVGADGTGARNLTNDPANDWGPDWSPDGKWIAFNSDRDGTPPSGYLVRPDGTGLRPIAAVGWFEYPSFSPDGRRIVFEAPAGSDYDIHVLDLETGTTDRLTDAPGGDGWPVWSPDGRTIAFSSERDDCQWTPPDQDCWRSGEPGEHRDIWLMNADGSEQRRVTPEVGQFVSWSPDGKLLLVSGHTLFAIRPDGTGRREIRPAELPYPPGGIPDWTQ